MQRRFFVGAALVLPALAQAQPAWPQARPIEVIVPFPAGGGVDVMTRVIMPLVAARIPGAQFVVVNRAGAAGQIGLEATYNAAPDGYTLGATTIPAHSAIPIERTARYRPLDFTFLANVVEDPNALFVRTESPLQTLAQLVAQAKARPGVLDYGTTGIGSDDHILMLGLEAAAGLPPLIHIPFAGAAPLTPQLLGGHIAIAVGNVSDTVVLAREGKVRVLGVAAASRVAEAPNAPTLKEQGYDLSSAASRGIVAPPGLPAAIAARLEAALGAAMADPAFKAEAARQSWPLRPLLGHAYKAMAADVDARLHTLWRLRPWRG